MATSPERFAQARRLSRGIIQTAERVKADFGEIVSALDIPPPLGRAVLELDEPAPMRDLAERLGCDRSYVTNLADGLEERGLIERVPGVDRRVKLLRLTPSGRDVRDRITERIAERSMVLDRLTDEQCAALGPLLDVLLAGDSPAVPTAPCFDEPGPPE
ncbi:MarR family transcriptional regulator [Actinotalea ferrariae]|uniref:MarR family winged helix-turn-helix transcriptional regulator n=1 Tax=Actinotalea ferrariae TaxID=1386098 RepID=UPI001C8BFDAC|nr:MarR family transcriptional regulator [Actinotalea ferrariae]MBX9243707.1 MarR family transcriptional regulator [Actinotalea ferrariae]